jgi:hypothetical protein
MARGLFQAMLRARAEVPRAHPSSLSELLTDASITVREYGPGSVEAKATIETVLDLRQRILEELAPGRQGHHLVLFSYIIEVMARKEVGPAFDVAIAMMPRMPVTVNGLIQRNKFIELRKQW